VWTLTTTGSGKAAAPADLRQRRSRDPTWFALRLSEASPTGLLQPSPCTTTPQWSCRAVLRLSDTECRRLCWRIADFNVISTLMLPAQPEERKADRDERPDVAGSVASERQLTGIINLDDGFQAASSPDRLSSLDPLLPVSGSKCWRQSRHRQFGSTVFRRPWGEPRTAPCDKPISLTTAAQARASANARAQAGAGHLNAGRPRK
jgi:hypothetical protein